MFICKHTGHPPKNVHILRIIINAVFIPPQSAHKTSQNLDHTLSF